MNYDGDPNSRRGQAGFWMRIAGLVFPALFVVQGIFVATGALPQDHYIGMVPLIIASTLFLITAIVSVLVPISFKPGVYIRTFVLQFFGLLLISITTGFLTPLTIIVVLMFYDSYRLLGIPGLTFSFLMFFIAIAVDINRTFLLMEAQTVEVFITVSAILLFMVVAGMVFRTQLVRQSVLEYSRNQEALQRYRMVTLVNNLRDGIVVTDEKGVIRIYNASALSLLDTNDSLTGKHLSDVLKVKDSDGKKVDIFSVLKLNGQYSSDELFYHYSDEVIRLSITSSELQSGMSGSEKLDIDDGFILILKDITKQKNLDDERDEFISVVSHELRTPLTIAEGSLSNMDILLQKEPTLSKKLSSPLKASYDQILFLSRMVNDLSTLSRAERGVADSTETIHVKELLASLYAEYTPQAKASGLKFDLDLHHHLRDIHVSRLYITELLQNLITNALKYTKEGSVTLKAVQHSDHITFSVVDTGIGISKSEQKKIYNKFYRSEDYRTRETRGTGLGLYVSLKLASKINSSINLKSRINHGSEFSFDVETK